MGGLKSLGPGGFGRPFRGLWTVDRGPCVSIKARVRKVPTVFLPWTVDRGLWTVDHRLFSSPHDAAYDRIEFVRAGSDIVEKHGHFSVPAQTALNETDKSHHAGKGRSDLM